MPKSIEYVMYDREHEINEVRIQLSNVTIKREDAEKIVGLLQGRFVESLAISHAQFEEGALETIAQAIGKINHEILIYLTESQIDDNGAKHLAEALKNKKLFHLDLSHNNIGNDGAIALAKAWRINNIWGLKLTHNQIGSEGAYELAKAFSSYPFHYKTFDLSYNLLGDRGAEAVALALPRAKDLTVRLIGNQIGLEGDMALAKYLAVPKTEIVYQSEEVDIKTLVTLDPSQALRIIQDNKKDLSALQTRTFTVEKPGLQTDLSKMSWGFQDYLKKIASTLFGIHLKKELI